MRKDTKPRPGKPKKKAVAPLDDPDRAPPLVGRGCIAPKVPVPHLVSCVDVCVDRGKDIAELCLTLHLRIGQMLWARVVRVLCCLEPELRAALNPQREGESLDAFRGRFRSCVQWLLASWQKGELNQTFIKYVPEGTFQARMRQEGVRAAICGGLGCRSVLCLCCLVLSSWIG